MMSRKLLAGIAGAMAMGLAVPAMAEDVLVTVQVESTASLTAADPTVLLLLDGTQGPENYDTFPSSLNHLNNTTADISVGIELAAALETLPADMQYWLFRGMTEAAAITSLQADAITNFTNGVFRFSGADVNLGVASFPFANLAVSDATTGDLLPVVYAADARNSLPAPATIGTVVTWTIAPTL